MANTGHLGKVTNFNQVFDPNTLAYVPMVQPSTGGGGGAGSTQVTISRLLDSSNAAVGVADSANNAVRVNVVAGAAGGSTQVSVKEILTSSGGSVLDSTAVAVRVNQVGFVAFSTTVSVANTVTIGGSVRSTNSVAGDFLATVTPTAGSTWATRPLQSSAADLQMTATPAAGSTWAVRPLQSSAADLQMTATPAAGSTWAVRPLQSSAADLQVTATPAAGSTFNVRPLQSSAADLQMTATPLAGSTWNVRPLQSSAGDLQVTATIGTNLQSTAASAFGSSGMAVRVIPFDSTAVAITLATAGDNSLISSVAAKSIFVYGLWIIPSTGLASTTAPTTGSSAVILSFQSGSTGARVWKAAFYASTATQAPHTIAVTPPQFLFKTAAAANLNCNATSSGAVVNVAAYIA